MLALVSGYQGISQFLVPCCVCTCCSSASSLEIWTGFQYYFWGVFLYFQVKQMKETADKTLSKVRREIRETRKMLDTVNRLQKLRAVRNDTAEKRGTNVFIIIKGRTCLLTCMLLFLYKKSGWTWALAVAECQCAFSKVIVQCWPFWCLCLLSS